MQMPAGFRCFFGCGDAGVIDVWRDPSGDLSSILLQRGIEAAAAASISRLED